jgi:HEAT repeat protein
MNRSLSPLTLELISRLYADGQIWCRQSQADPYIQLIRRLATQDEPLAIRHVMPLVFSDDQRIAVAAAEATHHLVRLVSPEDLPWLDEAIRHSPVGWIQSAHGWYELGPHDLSRLSTFEAAAVSLLGVSSFHPGGFVRQAAVELLGSITTGAELAFLLLRVNDWVNNIRQVARHAVRARLVPDYAPHFIRNLDLVIRLERVSRVSQAALLEDILTLAKLPQQRDALTELIRAPSRFQRRLAYRLLLEAGHAAADLLRQALSDTDPTIRSWAIDRGAGVLDGRERADLLVSALRDPVASVRSRALSNLYRHAPQLALHHARAALLDPSAVLRQQARFVLRQAGSNDFASAYRRMLDEQANTAVRYAAILGLGETGTSADARLVTAHLTDPIPRIRRAALWALDRLAGAESIAVFMDALQDPSPRVSQQSARILPAYLLTVDPTSLRRLLRETTQPHTKRHALRLIAHLRKWDSVELLLEGLGDPVPDIRERASAWLRSWVAGFNRSFSTLDSAQRVRLRALLDSRRHLLDPELRRELEFTIQSRAGY